ncbi:ABC transporter ATP-binding protein [Kineothrix sp. MB12-C1]|uniref:ABC transporter ATP-binding protein n=1 Tax=Kineothrix sp. MB12-C1 TaxID=3070215 RepID=UPI0027D296E5|nr:ABC transporter ATP-binding protein [Kineothrix sp. MB12-C1]WMC91702.1 ABC transporter ATP-binding protein [Kineothrix sp. MB12-C1]
MIEEVLGIDCVSKVYRLYEKPTDRIKETFLKNKKYHNEFYALKDINININKGETVGIIGRNGSGKSTLLKIITGVLNPTEGEVRHEGRISALLELGTGFNMEYTGIQNIYFNGTLMGLTKKDVDRKINDIIEFADIGDYINQPVKTYSSGMFVRLAFAVAISVEPEILIVDEALAVGDTRFQVKCMNKFTEFMEQGRTILFVSHDLNSVKRFCKRTIWINNGTVIMDGDTDEVTDSYNDFLGSDLSYEMYSKEKKKFITPQQEDSEYDLQGVDIAKITDVKLYNEKRKETECVNFGEDVFLRIKYLVKDTTINDPVLGVAIRTINNEYICGLNTLLDGIHIPWKKGINEVVLKYNTLNITGGHYYFDVALFDSTAIVQFDYQTQYLNFFVNMNYIAEGKVVLKHVWEI